MTKALESARLLLRAAHEGDLDAFHAMYIDEDVMKYGATPPHTSIDQTWTCLSEALNSRHNGITDFVIVLQDTKDANNATPTIGQIGCWDGQEIGLMLARPHWGKGYMAEAMEVFLPYFWGLGLVDAITADVDPRNEACLKLLRRFGFRETGFAEKTFKTQLGWCDSMYLKLERPRSRVRSRGRES